MTAKGEKVEHKTIHEAMAAAFAEMPDIDLDGVITSSRFTSRFATLGNLIRKTRPVLARHGLWITQHQTQRTDDGCRDIIAVYCGKESKFKGSPEYEYERREHTRLVEIVTVIWHESGGHIEAGRAEIMPDRTGAHGCGSAITYARRYSYAAALLIANQTDDDGNSATSGVHEHEGDRPTKRDVPPKSGKKSEAGATSAMYLAAVKGVSRINDDADAKQLANDILRRLQIDKVKAGPDEWAKAIGVLERIEKEGINLFEWVREVEVDK